MHDRGVGAEKRDLLLELLSISRVRRKREELLEVGDSRLRALELHPQVAAVTSLVGDLRG